jgi:hypothetical protein
MRIRDVEAVGPRRRVTNAQRFMWACTVLRNSSLRVFLSRIFIDYFQGFR